MSFNFEKLEVYHLGLEITDLIYNLTKKFPQEELFSLSNQLRRAAISVVLNIAEGSGRSTKEFCHFLNMSRTSCYECIAGLEIAKRQGYLANDEGGVIYNRINTLVKMINALRNSILQP